MLRTHTKLLMLVLLCATLTSAQRPQTSATKPPAPAQKPGTKTPAPTTVPAQPVQAQIGPESHIRPAPVNYQFSNGQTLHYTAEWRLWTAGTVSLKMESVGTEQRVTGTADSTGFV